MQSKPNRLRVAYIAALGMILAIGVVRGLPTLRADPAVPPPGATKLADLTHLSDQLPAMRTKNGVSGSFEFQDDDVMISGNGTMNPPSGVVPRGVQVNRIKTPMQFASVRIDLDRAQAKSLLAVVAGAAAADDSVVLADDQKNQYPSIGWVIQSGDVLKVQIDPANPIAKLGDFPVSKMRSEDKFFLYFHVKKNVKILWFKIGSGKTLPINLVVPK